MTKISILGFWLILIEKSLPNRLEVVRMFSFSSKTPKNAFKKVGVGLMRRKNGANVVNLPLTTGFIEPVSIPLPYRIIYQWIR